MQTNFWIKIFAPTTKKFHKKLIDEEINYFYWLIKLKAYFREDTKVQEQTEDEKKNNQ